MKHVKTLRRRHRKPAEDADCAVVESRGVVYEVLDGVRVVRA